MILDLPKHNLYNLWILCKGMPKKEEKDFMKVRNSRKLYLPLYIMVFVLIAVIVWIKYQGLPLNNLTLILVVLFIVSIIKYSELHRFNNSYEINKNSLVHTKGILSKTKRSMDFFAVSDFEVKQSPWQRMLGFGNVSVRLYSGKSEGSLVRNINKPSKFAEFLRKMIENKRKEGGEW